MAIRTRLRQGIRALFAFTQVPDYALAERYLNHQQMALFQQMSRSEQLHSLNVLCDVLTQSQETPSSLAVSALLHDVGKSLYPLAIWQKSVAVIVRKVAPALYVRWSEANPKSRWYRAFVVAEKHPIWSRELVESTGADGTTLWLVEHHADQLNQWDNHPNQHLLKRLKQADDSN